MKILIASILLIISTLTFSQEKGKVRIGDKALNFSLNTIQGNKITLKELYLKGPVVLVVLRGWPGYQCPICTRQVGSLVAEADTFDKYGTAVLMVYLGPTEELQKHAKEFAQDFQFPQNYYFTIDPEYSMINKYGLRWDAPRETAYPSTFVINKKGKVVFAKVSNSHGGRSTPEEIFKVLAKL